MNTYPGKHAKPIAQQVGQELMDAWNGPEITGKDRPNIRVGSNMAVMGIWVDPRYEFFIEVEGAMCLVTVKALDGE